MSFAAGKVRVLIATTNGPVEVQLLTEEDAAIGRCVACIGGTTETADIAPAYHAFVVRPTGVIEARFGHSCYRLDVSARIDAGSSWQLGVLAAHALLAAGRLAQENEVADGVLWATGSVRPVDLTVGAVSHVPEKLANSLDRLKQERGVGRAVLIAVPAANAVDVTPTAARELLEIGAELVTVAHAQALFDALSMKLPAVASRGASSSPLTGPQTAEPVKVPRRIYSWAAAIVALIAIAAVGTLVTRRATDRDIAPAVTQQRVPAESEQSVTAFETPEATPAPLPPSQPSLNEPSSNQPSLSQPSPSQPTPNQPTPKVERAALVPETLPFIANRDRQRIRDEYMTAPDYKALVMTMLDPFFVTGRASQEAADKAAMEACESAAAAWAKRRTLSQVERTCTLYASGTVVVAQGSSPPVPPKPWINPSGERPFAGADIPLIAQGSRDSAETRYRRAARPKAFVVGPDGRFYFSNGQSSAEEAVRRTLERCGRISNAPCLVVAVDDIFVATIPTLARAVGLYRQDALPGAQAGERAEVARAFAGSTRGWNAVAVGAGGHAGIKLGAATERAAVDGAMEDCAKRDRDCRIAVIGPFLVEAAPVASARPAP
jgi:hypothetical protein